ncbi:hypothetical protein ACTWJ9_33625 (plasmid) [Streptomyces sp. GDS52]|uniref:hypothetical protein n=1 Tax=Streptomyces sp. GDS52 TaxID=3406419 RepID=UPI003FD19492
MASNAVPAAVPGPTDPPPSTAPTTPAAAGGTQQQPGGMAGLLAPVTPTRTAFTLDPDPAAEATPGDQAVTDASSATYRTESTPDDTPGNTGKAPAGKQERSVLRAWMLAGAERWKKGADARNKRLDIQKAKAQARQVKETVTVNRAEKMVGGSTNSSTGSKNNAAGKSLNSKSNGAGNGGGTGPKNRPGGTNSSGGGQSGSTGRSGSGGPAGGGSRGSNTGTKPGGSGRTSTGNGKDSSSGRGTGKDSGPVKQPGGKPGGGSGAGPKHDTKPTGPGPKTSGGSGGGAGKSGSSGTQGPAGKPGKDGSGPKTPTKSQDATKPSTTGPAPDTGKNTPTGTETRPKGPDSKGNASKVRLDKTGRTNGKTADGTPGTDPKKPQRGDAQPTTKDGQEPRKPQDGGTGTQQTAKTGTAKDGKGTEPTKQTGPRVPAPRINLQNSREAGYRDGTRAAKAVAHTQAWRDGARDGYADTTQAAAREKTRLDKAHTDRKNARTHPEDTPVTAPASSADYQTVPPKPDHAPGPQPVQVASIDATHVHLGDGAARPSISRGEVRTLRQFQQRLEAKTDTMTRVGEATRVLEQHALEQAKQVTDLLEQARSVEGGEKVVAALTRLADTAQVQAGKAAEIHQRAVRAGEACTVLHTNTETRYGGIYQAVQDSPETRAARMTYYRDMETANV